MPNNHPKRTGWDAPGGMCCISDLGVLWRFHADRITATMSTQWQARLGSSGCRIRRIRMHFEIQLGLQTGCRPSRYHSILTCLYSNIILNYINTLYHSILTQNYLEFAVDFWKGLAHQGMAMASMADSGEWNSGSWALGRCIGRPNHIVFVHKRHNML